MRKSFSKQGRLNCLSVGDVQLNLDCRDEFIPILAALQHVYSQPELGDAILDLVAADVNRDLARRLPARGDGLMAVV